MRIICIVMLLYFKGIIPVLAQNQIQNGGFETHIGWMKYRGNKLPPNHWYFAGGSRIRFGYNTFDAAASGISSINNLIGYQCPRHGNIMMSIGPYGTSHMGMHLISRFNRTLAPGRRYFLEFSVSRADYSCYSTSNIDICLSPVQVRSWQAYQIWNLDPSFRNPLGPIKDSLGWVTVFGEVTAVGDEKYFILGNFDDESTANLEPCDWSKNRITQEKKARKNYSDALYFLDDILVKPIGWSPKFNMPPEKFPSEKELKSYFSKEFVFPKGDSVCVKENNNYFRDIAREVRRKEGSFVEICASVWSDEDSSLAIRRSEYISAQLRAAGLEANQISVSVHCENKYKMNVFHWNDRDFIAGAIEVTYR